MTTLEMGDSSTPVVPPANLPVYAVYLLGDTPHIWTGPEIKALRARWCVPICVHDYPAGDPRALAAQFIAALHGQGVPGGSLVALDTESTPMPEYVAAFNDAMTAGGYPLAEYESKGPLGTNPPTSGGRWVADWTGVPHLFPGSIATQYASSDMIKLPWDASVIDGTVKLWEIHPPVVHVIPQVAVSAELPELANGDTGPAVKRMQHLILAWNETQLPGSGPDGIFGPETLAALRLFQRMYGITTGAGSATAETWTRLVAG